MPQVCRVGDNALCPACVHGKPCCPHVVVGPATQGSPDVIVNGQPVLRIGDPGVHAACCGSNSWNCAAGSATVIANGIPVVRIGDATTHCGGGGNMIQGSPNVIVG